MSLRIRRVLLASAALFAALIVLGCQTRVHRDVLWQIVSRSCVPAAAAGTGTGMCAKVSPDGYAILKDIRGPGQYLLIPTARVTGVESPVLRQPDTPDYFGQAWNNRHFVSTSLGVQAPDGLLSLALNSVNGRSQDQLHIHIECLSQAMRNALDRYNSLQPGIWVHATFQGHPYALTRVVTTAAANVHPYDLVRKRAVAAGQDMADHTIFMATAPGGFFVVDGIYRDDDPKTYPGSSEELQDHTCQDVRQQASGKPG